MALVGLRVVKTQIWRCMRWIGKKSVENLLGGLVEGR